jgi:hypothetical protein
MLLILRHLTTRAVSPLLSQNLRLFAFFRLNQAFFPAFFIPWEFRLLKTNLFAVRSTACGDSFPQLAKAAMLRAPRKAIYIWRQPKCGF